MTRRTLTIVGGVVAAIGLLVLVLATPVLASRNGMHGWRAGASGEPVAIAAARERAAQYLSDNGYTGLEIGGVIEFTNHFYVVVIDPATGNGALELIVSRDAAAAHLAAGPAMMWNTTFVLMPVSGPGMMSGMMGGQLHGSGTLDQSMHGGMMGRGQGASHGHGMLDRDRMHGRDGSMAACPMAGSYVPGTDTLPDTPLTVDGARDAAQAWLDGNRNGLTTTTALEFPGYVTFVTERDGAITGLLAVQMATGALWEHSWHGEFVAQEGIQ